MAFFSPTQHSSHVFDFSLLKGDPATALARPRSVILTEEYAEKYFGDQDPMDKQLSFESDTVIYTVTGVIQDIPDNSHIKFDMLASMSSYPRQANDQFWISHSFYTYIVVRDGTDKDLLEERFQGMVTKYVGPQITAALGISVEDFLNAGNSFSYVMEPLKDLHLRGARQYNLEPLGSESTVYIFAVIALLVLVIAIINYINLATARSATRAREVGVRKVAGANKRGLVFQFLGESVLIVTTATIIAVILVYALTPSFNQLIGKELSVSILDNAGGILSLLLLIILVGISSGAYPAFILASFNPIEVLKGTLNPGSMSKNMRGVLVVVQFTISIVIIIGSIIVYRQLNYLTTKDIGFEKENLIVIRRADAFFRQREAFRDQLLQMPGVVNAGFTRAVPGTTFNNNAFLLDDDPEKNTYLINQTQASFDFAQTLGVELAEGRFFSREYGEDSTAILINEAAVKSLGLTDPVGKYLLQPQGPQQFQRLKIIGVMKDFNIKSMHIPIEPVCFTVLGNFGGDQFVAVRLTGEDVGGTVRAIEQKWQSFTPEQPFQYDFFTDSWNNLYSSEMKTGKIFILFSLLAIFLACLGLLGLITYITNKRTREVGIRKTYGASVQVILRLLSKEVVYLILISSLLAYPIAYFGSKFWLEAFASRVTISPLIYVAATIIALTIGWLSILYQTYKAASYSPADALRLEK